MSKVHKKKCGWLGICPYRLPGAVKAGPIGAVKMLKEVLRSNGWKVGKGRPRWKGLRGRAEYAGKSGKAGMPLEASPT